MSSAKIQFFRPKSRNLAASALLSTARTCGLSSRKEDHCESICRVRSFQASERRSPLSTLLGLQQPSHVSQAQQLIEAADAPLDGQAQTASNLYGFAAKHPALLGNPLPIIKRPNRSDR